MSNGAINTTEIYPWDQRPSECNFVDTWCMQGTAACEDNTLIIYGIISNALTTLSFIIFTIWSILTYKRITSVNKNSRELQGPLFIVGISFGVTRVLRHGLIYLPPLDLQRRGVGSFLDQALYWFGIGFIASAYSIVILTWTNILARFNLKGPKYYTNAKRYMIIFNAIILIAMLLNVISLSTMGGAGLLFFTNPILGIGILLIAYFTRKQSKELTTILQQFSMGSNRSRIVQRISRIAKIANSAGIGAVVVMGVFTIGLIIFADSFFCVTLMNLFRAFEIGLIMALLWPLRSPVGSGSSTPEKKPLNVPKETTQLETEAITVESAPEQAPVQDA